MSSFWSPANMFQNWFEILFLRPTGWILIVLMIGFIILRVTGIINIDNPLNRITDRLKKKNKSNSSYKSSKADYIIRR